MGCGLLVEAYGLKHRAWGIGQGKGLTAQELQIVDSLFPHSLAQTCSIGIVSQVYNFSGVPFGRNLI